MLVDTTISQRSLEDPDVLFDGEGVVTFLNSSHCLF
jgi:hypothetical protein